MVKYLLQTPIKFVLIITLLTFAQSASKQPIPTCNSPKVNLQNFPISLQETQDYNMNDFFSGYNLNITILNKPDFVYLRDKLTLTKNMAKAQPGLRNYHLAHRGNQWGAELVTISTEGNSTKIRWGSAAQNQTIPELSNEAIIQNQPATTCYDSVWFRTQMIIMADCVTKNNTFGLQNIFIYMNSSSQKILGRAKNDMYVPFNVIWHRKIALYREDGYNYLIRAYFAQSVDQHYSHNTYAEILSVNNPMKPWTIRVMDRSFLHQDKLSIMDFEVYLGDIYLLDYHSGVIKFDITPAQTIAIVGRYRTDSGFTKLGVYSNNLDNQFLLVLAHDHAIYEVDWSNQIKPQLVTKYSIPESSWIHDLWVNEQYVVVQISANLTDSKNQTFASQSTYVFSRGTRTYLNAYAAIPHPSFRAWVDFNRDTSEMMTFDTERISIYQLATPMIYVVPTNPTLLNKQFGFTVKAESKNQYNPDISLVCTFSFKWIVVPDDSLSLWETGLTLPKTYYANYPGQLFIPLDRYVLGSNITYGVKDNGSKDPPSWWILQQNGTRLHWNKQPSLAKITFLAQEQFDTFDDTYLFLYIQDAANITHFAQCQAIPFTEDVRCRQNGFVQQINYKISNLSATVFHYYQNTYLHLVAILYAELPNQIFIYNLERGTQQILRPIIFPSGYEGLIHSIQYLGHYLVVVLKYVKQIVFFDMIQCHDHQEKECQEVYRINATTMSRLGVTYFSPVAVYTSDFHPFVLFVQCLDKVVIMDITRRGPILLSVVDSPATKEPGFYKWKMAFAEGQMILVNPPNIIEEHSLAEIYTNKNVPLKKVYPTFGYVIPDNFDLDASDAGNLIYITAIDPKLPNATNSVILVYRTGLPAVSSFYDVFNINGKYDDMLIDATGSFGDYIAVSLGSMLLMFRQYQIPILVFQDSFTDYSFNVSFTNDPHNGYRYLFGSQVKIANYPEDIIVNDSKLNNSNYLGSLINYENTKKRYYLDDYNWFNGSVLNYTLEGCNECNNKLKVINHVEQERDLLGVLDMEDYAFSFDGGYIQQYQSIIKMRHNGSINQFVNLPSVLDGEACISIEHSWIYDYTLSACKNGFEVYLYTTVFTASKPFVNGPYYSSAKHVTSMHVMNDLMVIVDVDERPWTFDREGGVLIYAMNHDPFEPEIFDELQFIDTNDLIAANDWPGGPCFIANAHFAFTNESDTYRLVITQLRNGLFIVDFRWNKGRKSVEILKLQFIDLKQELIKLNLPLPNGAFFTAVAINKQRYDSTFGYWLLQVIVVTFNFHTFQVNLHIDKTGTVVTHEIAKVYYRYGFYENQNYIKAFDGYFAIAQKLPVTLQIFNWYSPQVLTLYDTLERWQFNSDGEKVKKTPRYLQGTKIPVVFMHGGQPFRKGRVSFDFNFTFVRNTTNPIQSIGLVALHNFQARIRQYRVHTHLIIEAQGGISSNQNGYLKAMNDYHSLKVPLNVIISTDGIAGWAIALIVIGSVAIAAIAGYFIYVKLIKPKSSSQEADSSSQIQKSLLEREADEEDDDDDDDDDEDEEEEQQEQNEEQAEQKLKEVSADPTAEQSHQGSNSINRVTMSSQGGEQAKQQIVGQGQGEGQGEQSKGEQ